MKNKILTDYDDSVYNQNCNKKRFRILQKKTEEKKIMKRATFILTDKY